MSASTGGRVRAVVAAVAVAVLTTTARAAPIEQQPAFYPEGPSTVGQSVFWAEMPRNRVRRFEDGATETVWEERGCGPTMVKRRSDGRFWVLCHLAHKVVLLSPSFGKEREFATAADGGPISYPNDGSVDSAGRLFFSSAGLFSLAAPAGGYLMMAEPDGPVRRLAGPFRYANGVAIDEANRRVFVSEHLARRVLEIRLTGQRTVASVSTFFDLNAAGLTPGDYDQAGPDGLFFLAATGRLMVAEYGASRVHLVSPSGSLVRTYPVETKFVTNFTPSPWNPDELIVVGTYDNASFSMAGKLMRLKLPSGELAQRRTPAN